MIQFVGESELVFHSDHISVADFKYHLHKSMDKYEILKNKRDGNNHMFTIKFVITIREMYHCKSLDDYISYSYSEHRKKLPPGVASSYVKVYKTTQVPNKRKQKYRKKQ